MTAKGDSSGRQEGEITGASGDSESTRDRKVGVTMPRWWWLAGAAAVVLGAAIGGWSLYRQSRIRWATNEGLPEIARLLAKDEGLAAFDLAQQVKRLIPDDPKFQQLWPEVTHTPLIETDPPGAEIYLSQMGWSRKRGVT